MNTSKKPPTSPDDPVVFFDIYGEELKNSNFFSSPSQNKSIDEQEKGKNDDSSDEQEEKKLSDDKENQYHASVITPYKRRNYHTLLRSPLYDITPCPKSNKKESCNVTPKTLDYFSTPKINSTLKKKSALKEIREMR